ncbi:Beta-glucosidase [Trichinella pseudospiralis]
MEFSQIRSSYCRCRDRMFCQFRKHIVEVGCSFSKRQLLNFVAIVFLLCPSNPGVLSIMYGFGMQYAIARNNLSKFSNRSGRYNHRFLQLWPRPLSVVLFLLIFS